jgi:hypothetical protein
MRNLNQPLTYWGSATDGYGGYTFTDPVVIYGRWEERSELFRTDDGEQLTSRAVVFVDTDVGIGGYLCEGDHSADPDPTVVAGAQQIRQFSKIPDLRRLGYARKAYL